jgi:hypothetical protein
MQTFIPLLKLIMAPTLIGLASLAGRKWGPAISGWIVGMPLTTGPVIFILAVQQGTAYATTAALGTLSGGLSLMLFALTYSWLARSFRWPLTLTVSLSLFFVATFILQQQTFALIPLFVVIIGLLLITLRLMPPDPAPASPSALILPWWDLPLRMIVVMALIFTLTSLSDVLGPRLIGLLATFPVYASTLAAFAHQLQGPAAAARVQRGLLLGLFSFAGFYLCLGLLLQPYGIAIGFSAAIGVALLIQGGSLFVLRHGW